MSTQSLDFTSEMSTTPPFYNGSTAMDNNTTIMGTFTAATPTNFELDKIAANDITSRANYVYALLAGLGFVAGCFSFYSFTQTYRAQRRLAWLDCLLWAFCGFQLLLLLLSLHAVAYRPHYLHTTGLGCAALAFTVNTASLCGLLVLALMAYVLTLDPPSHTVLRKPGVCVGLVILISVVVSVLLAGYHGPHDNLETSEECFMDFISTGVSYTVTRMCLIFLIPYILQVGLLICGCVRQWKSKGRFLAGSEEGPVFLIIAVVMFFCHLFYSVVLVRGAQLQQEGLSEGAELRERAFVSVAEFVLFSGSALSLLLVLFMHRPCRESLHGAYRQLRDCCRSPGHTQANRNIIAPHIEITDTLQDIES